MAKLELETLIDKNELNQSKFEELDAKINGLIDQIPGVQQILAVKENRKRYRYGLLRGSRRYKLVLLS